MMLQKVTEGKNNIVREKYLTVSDEVYDVFSLTGFDSKIDIQKK